MLKFLVIILLSKVVFADVTYDADGHALTDVPSDIPSEVSRITLQDNNITSVSSNAFDDLNRVETLIMNKNLLETFPNLIGIADTLLTLELAMNNIHTIDEELMNALSKLTRLDLSDNRLAAVPKIRLNNLNALFLMNCKLTEPPMFENSQNLGVLKLSRNPDLLTFPDNYFAGMTSLKQLWIKSIGLTEFVKFSGGQASALEELRVSKNDVSSVPAETMAAMVSLKTFRLEEVSHVTHQEFTKVLHVILYFNEFTEVVHTHVLS